MIILSIYAILVIIRIIIFLLKIIRLLIINRTKFSPLVIENLYRLAKGSLLLHIEALFL